MSYNPHVLMRIARPALARQLLDCSSQMFVLRVVHMYCTAGCNSCHATLVEIRGPTPASPGAPRHHGWQAGGPS
ncbi:hypothetical protein E2C01_026628 [Portunus trituberculatus]|uniref:Uncharacterized protein n=1 Tax=Portunus trituberculatus TaxID=210409 RepID=A0A5B7ELH7_PORTR|nr:hypothetical protein [Portunus trituberculatus]